MTIGRPGNRPAIHRQKSAKARRRDKSRQILLESLELRQLMAVGPQLISIQPNEGELIRDGQVLYVSPSELIVRFDDSTAIDATTIGNGIQINRTGGDGAFDRAYVSSDLGTNGAVVVDFAAAVPGQTGNGMQVTFTKAARSDSRLPILTVLSRSINVQVNTTAGLETRVQDLITAFRNNASASARMSVVRLRGSELTSIANTVQVGTPLILSGANTARATSNLNAGSNVLVEFLAAQAGPVGLNSQIVITARDFGGPASPIVTASGQTVNIQVNSSTQFRTTLGQFVDAINSSAAAANVLQARIISGARTTAIGVFPATNTPIRLSGVADTLIKPGYIGLGDSGREVIIRFAEPLPDDNYRIDILGAGTSRLTNVDGQAYNNGVDTSLGFVLDLGVRIEAVVPQPIPIERDSSGGLKTPLYNIIHVYFDKSDLNPADVTNPRFYQLRYTNDKLSTEDDLIAYPRLVRYSSETGRAELEFARNLDEFFNSSGGKGAFRLRIGSTEDSQGINFGLTPPGPGVGSMIALGTSRPVEVSVTTDPGSRFDTATNIDSQWTPAASGPSSIVLSSEIRNTTAYQLDFPGADSEPGNRRIRYQQHVTRTDTDGIEIIEFNFQGFLGTANGSVQLNAITEDQKALVRRVLSLYENYLGVRFIETTTRGFTIAVGDLKAINVQSTNGPSFPFLETGALLANGQMATIIDIQDFNTSTQSRFGSDLFRTFARGIGNLLGLGTADEIPGLTVQSNNPVVGPGIDTELVFPGNSDIVYGQYAHRPEGTDIDLYRFTLPTAGKIKIEIAAERLDNSSLLDSALKLYQRTGNGWNEVAINDDYFSQDSFIALDLVAGEYVVGVSAKGNQAYDPNIEDSGLGGRSEGRYELRMDFRPPENLLMRETLKANQVLGTALDGDSDGRAGGIFDFWFVPSGAANTFFVDKNAPGTTVGNGAIATPFRKISDALSAVATTPIANRIIRIVGNGGADGLIQTPADNLAYEIGFNRLGQAQADGTTLDVPKNVTVMVDAGAIVKLTRARIGVGSTTISVDRSGGALQVLGVPRFIDSSTGKVIVDSSNEPIPGNVYFTSINDTALGRGSNRDTAPPAPGPGDWGGIDINNRIDSSLVSATRVDREAQGLFLNAMIHADIRYGGGQVIVDGVSQVITPIHMIDARPTIANSLISKSADAAMSATPNSFKESNFHDPSTQQLGGVPDTTTGVPRRFIADYDRVGPDIHGNHVTGNTINGLFIKTRTGAASTTEVVAVPGRFDDLDIVHVVSENLVVQGSAGGVTSKLVSPVASTVVMTPSKSTGLTNGIGDGTYRYKFAFIDSGVTGPASAPSTSVTITNSNGALENQILLSSLPSLTTNQRLAIYRSTIGSSFGFGRGGGGFGGGGFGGRGGTGTVTDGPYRLVGTINATQTSFLDQIASSGNTLSTFGFGFSDTVAPSLSSNFVASAIPGVINALSAGRYAYQLRLVSPDGGESASVTATTGIDVLTTPGVANGRIDITNLPVIGLGNALRIYRATVVGGVTSSYALVGTVPSGTRSFIDINTPFRLSPPNSPAPSTDVAPPVMVSPSSTSTTFTPSNGSGALLAAGRYIYQFAFAALDGSESTTVSVLAGGAPIQVNVLPIQNQVLIANLPAIPVDRTLQVYRAVVPTTGQPVYELVGIVPSGAPSFTDQNPTLILSPATNPDAALPVPSSSVILVPGTNSLTNSLTNGSYVYRFTYSSGFSESEAIPDQSGFPSTTVAVATSSGVANGQVTLSNLPEIPTGQSLRIYRGTLQGGRVREFNQIASLTGTTNTYIDTIAPPGTTLDDTFTGGLRARTNGSLVVDPGTVMKFQSSRIEVQDGGQLMAEGLISQPIIMTSINDVRFGAGGTFDTANRVDPITLVNRTLPVAGNWGGLYVGQGSGGSLDHVRLSYGGGTTRIEGGFASFNPIEAHQAELRIANSRLDNNASGVEDGTPIDRAGRGTNFTATIFVRGSQPIIVNNQISDNLGAAVNIDVDSLNADYQDDTGRSSGAVRKFGNRPDNQGPLIESNRISNNEFNGMMIRGQTLTTEGVWDDADIVHVVRDEVVVENFYTYGGLRLESKPTTSLVVKFAASGATTGNGLTATGRTLDIADRIGGSVQIVGQPGFPVILTSLSDDSVGAGFKPDGRPNVDTNNDGEFASNVAVVLPTGPEIDNGILIDNDVDQAIPGFFSYQPQAGGGHEVLAPATAGIGLNGITAQGRNQLLTNVDAIFDFINYIDVGSDGTAISLASTTITLPPTLISPDLVASEGSFINDADEEVTWRVESRFDNGIAQLVNTLTFTTAAALGNIRYINYFDEEILGVADDILFTRGTPGQADFRVLTVDGAERFGFSQGGIYLPGAGLQNASYVGWTADSNPLLQGLLVGAGTTYTVPGNINLVSLPAINDPAIGNAFGPGNVTTGMAWDCDPTATTATITTFLELLPQESRGGATPGEWRGLLFETESNDRNVAVVNERELARSSAQAVNDSVPSSQLLGTLASLATGGDENARLGYQIQGTINRVSDKDVYSFYALGGTEVWFDIDKTHKSFDSVVELIDANGQIIALSDNSFDEEEDPSLLYRSTLSTSSVNPLRKSSDNVFPTDSRGQPKDLYSTNPKDAGFRVSLPGPVNQSTLYHVRVRSSNAVGLNDAARVARLIDSNAVDLGRSDGSYQLQIRLTEADEFPGSSVSYADIRFATTGIDLAGVPRHSPLLGETAEQAETFFSDNDTFANAQDLGNILDTDRASISLAGSLRSAQDVDWFTFTIDYNMLSTRLAEYFSTVLDIDYADGVGRPDTSIYLYNANGNLLSFGLNSNILDDRAGALRGADNGDLGRGSAGSLDPFIGATELRAGQYFVAVTSQGMIPLSLLSFNDTVGTDRLLRVQPSNNSDWIVEDRVEQSNGSTAFSPIVPNFLPNNSAVPFTLGDVALYLNQDAGSGSNIYIANPKTGNISNFIGGTGQDFQDIAFRFNGDLRGFNSLQSAGAGADADVLIGYHHIDDGTGTATLVGQSNIQTSQIDLTSGDIEDANVGVEFNAITFANFGAEIGIAVGNRAGTTAASLNGIHASRPANSRGKNVIYRFNPTTGQAINGGGRFNIVTGAVGTVDPPDIILGNGTDVQERGFIETTPPIGAVSTSLLFPEATRVTGLTTTNLINDGDTFSIRTPTVTAVFEFNSGPQFNMRLNPDSGPYLQDGDRFTLDGQVFEIQTNTTPIAAGARPVNYTTTMTNADFALALQTAINLAGLQFTTTTALPVVVSQDGTRINFSGGGTILPIAGTSIGQVITLTGNGTVGPGRVGVSFLAADLDTDVAARAAASINGLGLIGLIASASGRRVTIVGGDITAVTGGVRREGLAPGGTITGVTAFSDGSIYAVSDAGGLFFVNNSFAAAETPNQVGTFITTATELIGINFTGLTAGPAHVEGGRYANMLFATTSIGDIVAFDTQGTLQNVFAGGASRISTGIGGLTGLAFSNLDYNLWHVTGNRGGNGQADRGHGVMATPDGAVQNSNGQQSWYFGFEGPFQNGVTLSGAADLSANGSPPRFGAGAVTNTYNFPGGALGVLESQPISLEDISASDLPAFYFTYYSTIENVLQFDNVSRDVLRAQAMGDNGVWQTLAINDVRDNGQNVFNNDVTLTSWRQARIDLSSLAGNREVRFRFTFSTGDGLGDFRGPELRTVEGARLLDGNTFTLSGQTFEIDLGASAIVQSGDLIQNNSTLNIGGNLFVLNDGTGALPAGRIVSFTRTQTASQIAENLAEAINLALLPVAAPAVGVITAVENANRVQITGGASVVGTGSFAAANAIIGSPGVSVGRLSVSMAQDMDADEVALAIQNALVTYFGGGAFDYPVHGPFVNLPGLTVSNAGPFTFTTSTNNNNQRSTQNSFEGIYLDDFIIGYAERGEIVSDPNADTTFVLNPNRNFSAINVGPYQLEIRGGSEYLRPSTRGVSYSDGFETNDRLSTGSTLQLTSSDNLIDGDYIDISDGLRNLRFVFKNTASSIAIGSGEIAVPYSTSVIDPVTRLNTPESGAVLASRLRDIINSPTIQNQLSVTAISTNGRTVGVGGDTIALSINAIVEPRNVNQRNDIANVNVNQRRGDTNTVREQGQILIENSKIADSLNFGIRLRADDRAIGSNNPNPGSVRNTVVVNTERLSPGAVIMNNELTGNLSGGISIVGDTAPRFQTPSSSIPFARIVNNTIIGGSVTQAANVLPSVFNDLLFGNGFIAFADRIPLGGYLPSFSGGPVPILGLDIPTDATSSPNYSGDPLSEPIATQGAVSLGNGGRLVVEFTDNILTGSGDARPDLAVFEVGISERVVVEVSADGVTYTSVGFVDGVTSTIDLDFYGFTRESRLSFVRLTDVITDGDTLGDSVGADIDAVGAISSVLATNYLAAGVGIEIGPNASPTLLNNIFVNNLTAVTVDALSSSTVIGGSVFQRNAANVPLGGLIGQFPLTVGNSSELFENAYLRRLYPRIGAPTIDASVDSLADRAGLVAVKAPLGLQTSPILAPNSDLNGLLRVDDPTVDTPAGLGENIFKDRGAQDRSDFTGPTAVVIDPIDNDTAPADVNPVTGIVELSGTSQPYFDIRLFDGGDLNQSSNGVGVDPLTVNSASLLLIKDGVTLSESVDYRFGFDATSNVIRLTPVGGVWPAESVYEVRFIKSGQFVIPMKSIGNSNDGATYTIIYNLGSDGFRRFELDLGVVLRVPQVRNATNHAIVDGGQFELTQGLQIVRYEFDNNGAFASNTVPIPILQSDTPAQVIDKMITAIEGSGLSVNATALGNNLIQIFGQNIDLTDLTANLTPTGNGGTLPGAIAIPLDAGTINTAVLAAEALTNAIRNAALPGVTVTQIGANILVEGAISVVAEGATVIQGIADRAGNPLRENQDNGTTVLTIQIGSGLDYGDAPEPSYLSSKDSNGPRHSIIDGFHLGSGNSADADARPNNADADDGLVFNREITQGYSSQLTVSASGIAIDRPGYLSAWIDFDQDGSFEDSERITTSSNDTLVNGTNLVNFNVPGTAKSGSTYARFRYSSTRGLITTGAVADGEVEDWLVNVVGNPYTNQTNTADVNRDGAVSPIDALQVINYLARNGSSSQLVLPRAGGALPPFVDVNGDGFVSPVDVLIVINAINRLSRGGSGEGEASLFDNNSTWIPASQVTSSVRSGASREDVDQSVPSIAMGSVREEESSVGDSENRMSVRHDSVWASVDRDPYALPASWLDEDELSSISQSAESTNSTGRSIHDDVFAELEGFDLS